MSKINKNLDELLNGLKFFVEEYEASDEELNVMKQEISGFYKTLGLEKQNKSLLDIYNEIDAHCLAGTALVHMDSVHHVLSTNKDGVIVKQVDSQIS